MAVAEAVLAHEPGWRDDAGRRARPTRPTTASCSRRRSPATSSDERARAAARRTASTLRLGAAARADRHPRPRGRARRRQRGRVRRARARHGLRAVGSADPRPASTRRVRVPLASRTCARSARPRAGARRAVVVGGGLLGLEAARGLRERGVRGHGRPPRRPPDGAPARPARRAAARTPHPRPRHRGAVRSSARRPSPRRAWRWPTAPNSTRELVVFATGIRPEVALARDAGLEVGRGILVDDNLRTSAPGVWAVGECAEHRGTVYGLWAPVLEQARAAGAAIAGRPERLPRRGPRDDAEGRRHRPLLRGRAPPSPTRSPRR